MKIKHIWSVLCKESIINQDDNVISLIGILEELNSTITPMDSKLSRPEKITIPFTFEVVSYWTKESDEEIKMQVKTEVLDPDGKELSNIVNESIFPESVKQLRTRLKVQGLTVSNSGRYHFRISLKAPKDENYKVMAELPMKVTIQIENSHKSSSN